MRLNSLPSLLLAASASLLILPLQAATPPASTTSPASAQDTINALTKAQSAVVGVQVTAAEGARSAQTLGASRSGSGVVIGADGLVVTIGYLILEADDVQITTPDRKTVPARVVAYDLATGFGLIRPVVPLRGISPVALGGSADIKTGEALMASTGASRDEDADVNMTQLVSKRAFSGYWEYHIENALFTSPPMQNHSGAPLFNQKGELLGIGSLFVMDAMGQNVRLPGNMFVPVDLLKPIMAEMLQTGSSKLSKRPWLGLTSAEQGGRVQIMRINADSPAQAAGLKVGDVVLAVDDAKVATLETFYKKIWDRASPEGEIKLTVLQGADLKTITLKAVDRMSTMRKPAGI
ncbi:S1C family serine protease [Variovorax sp. PCZ-1]|uniref:S1C family serine protease n=1 Tax=Variovorax sp. PCZ-1 TaxID=2835533 RepID=UPI001BCE3F29|nr:S1C family serine protease [Variovorax sp. PCZ-1]MBS7807190.1 serine protease [Variovorax sp. PCZ-1]